MGNVIFIAGQLHGDGFQDPDAYARAEAFLKNSYGWIVLNPAMLPEDLPKNSYMPIYLAMLQQADAIGMMPNWEGNEEARVQLAVAQNIGKECIEFEWAYGGFSEEEMDYRRIEPDGEEGDG